MSGPVFVLLVAAEKDRDIHVGVLNPETKKELCVIRKSEIGDVFRMGRIHRAPCDFIGNFQPHLIVKKIEGVINGNWAFPSAVKLAKEVGCSPLSL